MVALESLRPDCAQCAALCCTAKGFSRSAEFAFDKPVGHPCPEMLDDFRCGIHATLSDAGMTGCVTFDCFGAGQKVTQVTFEGRTWRDDPARAPEMFRVFHAMVDLHEMLWQLARARQAPQTIELWPEIDEVSDWIEEMTRRPSATLESLDTLWISARIAPLLVAASDLMAGSGDGFG